MPSFSNNFVGHCSWPKDVGIIDMEIYFPSQCVSQSDLEVYDKLDPPGKYTIGLGQTKMGFCDDREDIRSICLTVLTRLMEKSRVGYENIGRLDVGTESIIDKSKSVKSVLMQLFEESGNSDIEGVDAINACYGGTAALFNAINWIESSSWQEGKYAIVVAGDIAVYKDPKARPTGGAGAVAMLIGPNAPLVFERGLRSTFMKHVYDFYKPDLSTEYAKVDGALSLTCYLSALDNCYRGYKKKCSQMGLNCQVEHFDAVLFHTPFCKLVQKSFARLVLNDFLDCPLNEISKRYPGLEQYRDRKLDETYSDRELEKSFMSYSKAAFEEKTEPSLLLAKHVGNMYTPSLYGGLASLLALSSAESLKGKRIALFSYGSGMAASFFSLQITNDAGENSDLSRIIRSLSDIPIRLNSRYVVTPETFDQVMALRERTHNIAPYTPTGDISRLFPGTWYLTHTDEEYRRSYRRASFLANGTAHPLIDSQQANAKTLSRDVLGPASNGTCLHYTNGHSTKGAVEVVGS